MFKSFFAILALTLSAGALAQAGPVGAPGRFVIVHSPHIQSDTVLLDTATGKTWVLTQDSSRVSDPVGWVLMARSDNPAEMQAWFSEHPRKPGQ